jgi:hypothetical protein
MDLKVGDKVVGIFHAFASNQSRSIGEVKTVGKISYICLFPHNAQTMRFDRTGHETGNMFHAARIERATPEIIVEVRQENRIKRMVRYLSGVKWAEMDIVQIEKAYALIREPGFDNQ